MFRDLNFVGKWFILLPPLYFFSFIYLFFNIRPVIIILLTNNAKLNITPETLDQFVRSWNNVFTYKVGNQEDLVVRSKLTVFKIRNILRPIGLYIFDWLITSRHRWTLKKFLSHIVFMYSHWQAKQKKKKLSDVRF